jgi:hypothetical protein
MKFVMYLSIFVVSLFAFAQVPPVPDASGLQSSRKAPVFPLVVLQPTPFEFRGIRIGDEIKEAERNFISWKISSLSSKPGLCSSDGIERIETCTNVLNTGEYVNMTMLDKRVAQIYVSTDSRTEGNTYDNYLLTITCLGWQRTTAARTTSKLGQTAMILVKRFRDKDSAGRKTANTLKPARSNAQSRSVASPWMWKLTNWKSCTNSDPFAIPEYVIAFGA